MSNEKKRMKMAVISGASHAIRYKQTHPSAQEDEVVRYVSNEVNSILEKIDKELD